MDRDSNDHLRFCPIQTNLGQKLCGDHGAPTDVSTAVLIDEAGVHTESTAVLRLFPWMGFPWNVLGTVGLCVPGCIRDSAYRIFARNRGSIWRGVKRVMGWGDVQLDMHKDRIIGLDDMAKPLDPGWGFGNEQDVDHDQ